MSYTYIVQFNDEIKVKFQVNAKKDILTAAFKALEGKCTIPPKNALLCYEKDIEEYYLL